MLKNIPLGGPLREKRLLYELHRQRIIKAMEAIISTGKVDEEFMIKYQKLLLPDDTRTKVRYKELEGLIDREMQKVYKVKKRDD